MKSPKISVVIPSFNKVKYIGKTLDSIFDQNYPNLEVIVQDGGSTDGTVEIIKKYKNIIFESKKDGGQLGAINKGLKRAVGDIMTFINADDFYEKDAFKVISKAYVKNPGALWFAGQGRVVNENDIEIANLFTSYKNTLLLLSSKLYLLMTNYLIQPSVFFTKNAYNKYGPFTGTNKFVMEYDFWLKLARVQMPIVINKTLSNFRIEKDTKTKLMFNEILDEDEKIVRKYTGNIFILFLHRLNNLGRKLIARFI